MYPSTNNLGNTTTNNTPLSDYLPNDDDDNNNNSNVDSITYPNSSSSSFHPIHSPSYIFYGENPVVQHLHEYFLHQQQPPIVADQDQTAVTSMEKHTDEHVPSITTGLVKGSHVVDDAFCNQIPRKRTCKKDRHSKINTAHGPRDRRMRLSLEVAQKFFGLQDMLGFDKASKTVQWLLTKSKTAIKQLTNSTRAGNVSNTTSASTTSNNSECEVLSGIIDDSSLSLSLPLPLAREMDKAKTVAAREKKAVTTKGARVSRAFHPLAKETREKARARARERTVEKRIRQLGNGSNYYDSHQAKKIPCIDQTLNRHLGSWSPFEAAGKEESSSLIQNVNDHPSSFLHADHHHQDPVSPMQHKQGSVSGDHSSFNTPLAWGPPLFNYHHNIAAASHENHFGEFPCFGKPWDHAYDN